MDDLPTDPLLQIISLCNPGDLGNLRRVNTRFRGLVGQAEIELYPTDRAPGVPDQFPGATSLDLRRCGDLAATMGMAPLLACFPR